MRNDIPPAPQEKTKARRNSCRLKIENQGGAWQAANIRRRPAVSCHYVGYLGWRYARS